MTEEVKDVKPTALENAGAGKADLDAGQSFDGAPKAPVDTGINKPNIEDGKDETFEDGKNKDDTVAKDAVKPDPKKEEPVLKEYIKLDDPAGQGAIAVLQEAGVSPDEANAFFSKAAQSGKLDDINWDMIEAKIGKAKTFLVRTGVETFYNNKQKIVDNTVKHTHTIFGGEKNWDTVKAWAQGREASDPAFKQKVDSIRALLNEGGDRADIGARELLRLYNSDGGTKGLNATKLVSGDATGNVIGTPLTRADYVKELQTAHDRNAKPHEIEAIRQRRVAGLNANI